MEKQAKTFVLSWRRGPESNRRIKVLQSYPLESQGVIFAIESSQFLVFRPVFVQGDLS